MSRIHTIAATAVLLIVVVVTTIVEGYNTERFVDLSDSEQLRDMAARIDRIPLRFGDWKGEVIPDSEDMLRIYKEVAKVAGHRNIAYRHILKGTVVQVSIVCGHRRHVAIHTPDQCMIGSGFKFAEEERAENVVFPSGPLQARTAQFYRDLSTSSLNQRMLWCWAAFTKGQPSWIAPESGRVGLLGERDWYKLYVTVSEGGTRKVIDTTTSLEFLKEFIPELNRELFGAAVQPAAKSAAKSNAS